MSIETSPIAAAASIVGHPIQATSVESTSATTTYHRATVDGVGVFYREAGPKDAPTIVLLHGFPSSSREFDTLIPLLATRYHLVAPDYPGLVRVTPRRHRRMCTPSTIWPKRQTFFSSNSRSTNTRFFFMTMAARSAFASWRRIRSGCGRLSSRMPTPIRRAWAPSGLALRNIGPIGRRTRKCSMPSCRSRRPKSVTCSAPRIPSVITRTPGPTNTPTCRSLANARFKPICFTTTGRTSLRTQRGKPGCAGIGRRLWSSGVETIPRSSLPARRRSGGIYPIAKSICSTPVISPWTRRTTNIATSYSCVLGRTFRLTDR